ncbi:MAG: DUF3662 and FHA domain-containing protein [Thermoleophilia bacterium]
MSVLRGIEHRLESLFEGVFGRAFRAHVQPVEIARKLAKEMDDNKRASVSRVYAPNIYHLYLSPRDRQQFQPYEQPLLQELAGYLVEHARKQGYALLSTPRVLMREDADLGVGEFGIATQYQEPERGSRRTREVAQHVEDDAPRHEPAPPPPADEEEGMTRVYRPEPEPEPAPPPPPPLQVDGAALRFHGESHPLPDGPVVLGRSRECDLVVDDAAASRRHAQVRLADDGWWITDLGSTNGLEVNGHKVHEVRLDFGDRITIGQTDILFERTA